MKECAAHYRPQKKSRKHEGERVGGTANGDGQQPCPCDLVSEGGTTNDCKQKQQKAEREFLRSISVGTYLPGRELNWRSGTVLIRCRKRHQSRQRIHSGRATNRDPEAPCRKQDKSGDQSSGNRPESIRPIQLAHA